MQLSYLGIQEPLPQPPPPHTHQCALSPACPLNPRPPLPRAAGEINFVVIGVVLQMLSIGTESTRLTLVQILLQVGTAPVAWYFVGTWWQVAAVLLCCSHQ